MNHDTVQPARLPLENGATIAYHYHKGKSPGVMFCGGFKSDMTGTKALALEAHCRETGRAFVRFDYRGHGQSSGNFEYGTIGGWTQDAIAVLDRVTTGPMVLVGSSMGGWIMLLVALARPARIAGLVGIAPAPDFTEDLMWQQFGDDIRDTLRRTGRYEEPSPYSDDPYVITMRLIEEGRDHLLLGRPIGIACPMRILHGMADPDVPWRHSLRLVDAVAGEDVSVTFIKKGDHRLSEPGDIVRLADTVESLCRDLELVADGVFDTPTKL